jgi:hypothetical protein
MLGWACQVEAEAVGQTKNRKFIQVEQGPTPLDRQL